MSTGGSQPCKAGGAGWGECGWRLQQARTAEGGGQSGRRSTAQRHSGGCGAMSSHQQAVCWSGSSSFAQQQLTHPPTSVAAVGVGQRRQEVLPRRILVSHRCDDDRCAALVHLPQSPLVLRGSQRREERGKDVAQGGLRKVPAPGAGLPCRAPVDMQDRWRRHEVSMGAAGRRTARRRDSGPSAHRSPACFWTLITWRADRAMHINAFIYKAVNSLRSQCCSRTRRGLEAHEIKQVDSILSHRDAAHGGLQMRDISNEDGDEEQKAGH